MRQHHHSSSPYEGLIGCSRAVLHGDRIVVSGTAPLGPHGETVHGGAYEQATWCFQIILEAVMGHGVRREEVIQTRICVVDAGDRDTVGRAHGENFGEVFPAATMVVVSGLLDPRWRVEIEADAEVSR